jgi:hypothetical protein
MRKMTLFLLALTLLAGSVSAQERKMILDSNTAFYEGEQLRYIIPAPKGFKLITDEAFRDGYSMAFIPRGEQYDSATVIIGINIYKTRGMSFDSVLVQDTASLRRHYGRSLNIRSVVPLTASTGDPVRTFYLEADKQFLPNQIMAYYNGGTEMVIFELVTAPEVLKFKAEKLFTDCIHSFQPLKRGTLGQK